MGLDRQKWKNHRVELYVLELCSSTRSKYLYLYSYLYLGLEYLLTANFVFFCVYVGNAINNKSLKQY